MTFEEEINKCILKIKINKKKHLKLYNKTIHNNKTV